MNLVFSFLYNLNLELELSYLTMKGSKILMLPIMKAFQMQNECADLIIYSSDSLAVLQCPKVYSAGGFITVETMVHVPIGSLTSVSAECPLDMMTNVDQCRLRQWHGGTAAIQRVSLKRCATGNIEFN